jgi:SAM-dependent methyltransferase
MNIVEKPYSTNRLKGSRRLYPSRLSDRYQLLSKFTREVESVLALVVSEGEPLTVVDVGCADKPYRPLLPPGCNYIGVDLPGNVHADLHIDQNGRIDLPDEFADLVLSFQVLEHVVDPAAYLSECVRVLRPDGWLILSTHGHWMYHPDPVDYWRWTAAGLRRTLELAGLRVHEERGVLGLAASGAQLFQDGWMPVLPRILRLPFGLIMQAVIAISDRVAPAAKESPDAAQILTLSRKARP